ncbi:MAG: P27 family phage terminase small subunit [Planctomycetota bacterium]
MTKRGRPPKPDAIKIAEGTYRSDRHGDQDAKPKAEGVPVRPEMAMPEAKEFWDQYVPMLVEMGVAKRADTPRLQALAESWALLRRATKAVNDDPIDKYARIAYGEYSRQFTTLANEFGMNPIARSRIIIDKPQKKSIAGRKRG